MEKNILETVIGFVVLVIAGSFIYIAYQSGQIAHTNGYTVFAKFDQVGGLSAGTDVRMSGIKVGAVAKQEIDPATYLAIVTLNLRNDIKIPTDSTAKIVGDGLLGSKYVSLVPGADDTNLSSGGEIRYTQSSISLEQLLGKFVFGGMDDKKDEKKADTKADTNDEKEEDAFRTF
jgi:phospholipid/cholesterol/gamma-HCH transport system substrate-binding protein